MHEIKSQLTNEVLAFSNTNEDGSISLLIKKSMFPLLLGKDQISYENDMIGLIRAELYSIKDASNERQS